MTLLGRLNALILSVGMDIKILYSRVLPTGGVTGEVLARGATDTKVWTNVNNVITDLPASKIIVDGTINVNDFAPDSALFDVLDGIYYTVKQKADRETTDFYVSDTKPTTPVVNMKWLDSTDGTLYLYYANGGNPVWVEFAGSWAAEYLNANRIHILGALSDETTPFTAGTAKIKVRAPCPMTDLTLKISLSTPQTSGGLLTVDVNTLGASILTTKLTIDNGSTTSVGAATPYVMLPTVLADDQEVIIDVDSIGDGLAAGLKFTLSGKPA